MKRKIFSVLVALALVIGLFAVAGSVSAQPNGDRAVFEADIVPTPWSAQDLDKGEVYVRADGSIRVEIEGAEPETEYDVYLGEKLQAYQDKPSPTWNLLGTLITNEDGDGEFGLTLDPGTTVAAPVFAINDPGENPQCQFISGFEIEEP